MPCKRAKLVVNAVVEHQRIEVLHVAASAAHARDVVLWQQAKESLLDSAKHGQHEPDLGMKRALMPSARALQVPRGGHG